MDVSDHTMPIIGEVLSHEYIRKDQEGYLELRKKYNETGEPLDLFVLTCYAFNHQIRFNSKIKKYHLVFI